MCAPECMLMGVCVFVCFSACVCLCIRVSCMCVVEGCVCEEKYSKCGTKMPPVKIKHYGASYAIIPALTTHKHTYAENHTYTRDPTNLHEHTNTHTPMSIHSGAHIDNIPSYIQYTNAYTWMYTTRVLYAHGCMCVCVLM